MKKPEWLKYYRGFGCSVNPATTIQTAVLQRNYDVAHKLVREADKLSLFRTKFIYIPRAKRLALTMLPVVDFTSDILVLYTWYEDEQWGMVVFSVMFMMTATAKQVSVGLSHHVGLHGWDWSVLAPRLPFYP